MLGQVLVQKIIHSAFTDLLVTKVDCNNFGLESHVQVNKFVMGISSVQPNNRWIHTSQSSKSCLLVVEQLLSWKIFCGSFEVHNDIYQFQIYYRSCTTSVLLWPPKLIIGSKLRLSLIFRAWLTLYQRECATIVSNQQEAYCQPSAIRTYLRCNCKRNVSHNVIQTFRMNEFVA